MRRRLRACGGGGLLFLVTACGGTVAGGDPTAGEQLRTTGAQRCKSACVTLATCGNGASCACGCSCPAGATDCTCAPCDCGGPPTPAKCEADCSDGVNRVLSGSPQCENQMLAVLDCLGSTQCQPGTTPCKAQEDALASCEEADAHPGPAPAVNFGTPGNPGGITCRAGSGGVAAQGGAPPSPGALVCESGWDSCSDGRSYSIQCTATSTSDLSCSCMVNGVQESSFVDRQCTDISSVASASCGWNLL
jgi:hypothetical protein